MSGDAGPFYRGDIDGLRAIAIVSVVLYHAGVPGTGGGFVGVDVFFVISGFLITWLLAGEVRASGSVSLAGFYSRRIRRLFPALAVMVAVCCLLAVAMLMPIADQPQEMAESAIATALYLSNVYFWLNSPGYFDPSTDVLPMLHTWSLAVEEQFYLAWPPIILGVIALARMRKWPFDATLLTLAAAVLAASLAWCILRTQSDPAAAFFLLPSRAWELATGAILAITLSRLAPQRRPLTGTLCSAVGLIAILAAVALLNDDMPLPGYLTIAPVFGAGLVILGGHLAGGNPVQALLSTRPMVFIGLLSYSWYLWHWPLLAFARAYGLDSRNLPRDFALALLSLLIAWLSYRWIENPIRHGRPGPFRSNRGTLKAALVITLAICVSAGLVTLWAQRAERSPRFAALVAAKDDRPPLRSRCHQHDPFERLAPAAACTAGAHDRPPRLILWGDSHADQLSPLMQAFAESSPQTPVLSRSFSRCPPARVRIWRDPREEAACHAFNAAVMSEIATLQGEGLEGVVLAARWLRLFGAPRLYTTDTGPRLLGGDLDASEHLAALEETVRRLTAAGLAVIVIAPIPEMPYDVPGCVARLGSGRCDLPRAAVEEQRREVLSRLLAMQQRHPRMRVLDLIDALCDASLCRAERGGIPAYLDDHHLTATASRSLLPAAREALRQAAAGR